MTPPKVSASLTSSADAHSSDVYPTAHTTAEFAANLTDVRAKIDAAAARAGRSGSDVRLLPVSKTVPEERIRLAVAAGATLLGENKVQEEIGRASCRERV